MNGRRRRQRAIEEKAVLLILTKRRPTDSDSQSQEEKLQSIHLVRESEVLSGGVQSSSSADEASSEQATGIVMVTMPEESSDDYQTPPEHMMPQNFSKTESGGVGEMMVVDDTYDRNPKRMVDITNDSSDINTLMVDIVNGTEKIIDTEETNAENWVAETLMMLKNGAASAPKVFVEMPMREQEAINNKKRDDHHRLDSKGKRRLPSSMVCIGTTDQNHDVFVDILNRALKLLKGDQLNIEPRDDGDDDFLAIAILRGMTFPRPRWWPGYL